MPCFGLKLQCFKPQDPGTCRPPLVGCWLPFVGCRPPLCLADQWCGLPAISVPFSDILLTVVPVVTTIGFISLHVYGEIYLSQKIVFLYIRGLLPHFWGLEFFEQKLSLSLSLYCKFVHNSLDTPHFCLYLLNQSCSSLSWGSLRPSWSSRRWFWLELLSKVGLPFKRHNTCLFNMLCIFFFAIFFPPILGYFWAIKTLFLWAKIGSCRLFKVRGGSQFFLPCL